MSTTIKSLVILGSTGSIGRSTLEVAACRPGDFHVAGLAAGRNVEELADQIGRFNPRIVSVASAERRDTLVRLLRGRGIDPRVMEIGVGEAGAEMVASLPEADIVVSAMVGFAGLRPTFRAVTLGKTVALANKETLVAAGELIMRTAKSAGALLLPVDSEHNAIFQCLAGQDRAAVSRLWLTASGGPFLHTPAAAFPGISVEEALSHPTWKMGRKITIDSATLMNKGLEVIEAHWLFGMPPERIRVVVHPQSVIHSMVEFCDGSFLAQLGVTDMKLPIRFALDYPRRAQSDLARLNPFALPPLEFFAPDEKKFPCLGLAAKALAAGGTAPAILNAANEVAVSAFLEELIPFTAIPDVIQRSLDELVQTPAESIEAVEDVDRRARESARNLIRNGVK